MASINENNTSTSSSSAKRKAAAFVNVNLVNKTGDKSKQLGGVPLYADNDFHIQILEHLKNGGELSIETSVHVIEDTRADEFLF